MTEGTGPSVQIVLASGSPWRARILTQAGVPFERLVRPIDEETVREALAADGATAEEAAVLLAELKAQAVASMLPGDDTIVLGFDQILDLDGSWLGKPGTREGAWAHLRRLQGRMHRLATAVVAFRGGSRIWHEVRAPRLWLRPLDDAFIEHYLATAGEDILQTVGAYAYEAHGAQLMAKVEGDFFTVLGVPLLPLLAFLREQKAMPG